MSIAVTGCPDGGNDAVRRIEIGTGRNPSGMQMTLLMVFAGDGYIVRGLIYRKAVL